MSSACPREIYNMYTETSQGQHEDVSFRWLGQSGCNLKHKHSQYGYVRILKKGHNSGSPKLELGKYVPDAQNNAHWDHM